MQTVIVYRNPLEAAFWETMMNGGFFVFGAVVLIAVLGVMTYLGIDKLVSSEWRRARQYSWATQKRSNVPSSFVLWLSRHNGKISITASIVFGIAMFYYGHM